VRRSLNNFVLAASATLLLVSFWQRNELPGRIAFRAELANSPRQERSAKSPFDVEYAGVSYSVEPQFEYDLYGMVVSYRQHDGTSRMHQLTNDHLNAADVCVVWSDTAFSPLLREIRFWNGIFTCNFQTSSNEAWARFNPSQLSNNHLLSANALVRKRIADIAIGDQIRIRGWLASYGSNGSRRGTSTTREDTGDGACETIYIDDFEILEHAVSRWRLSMYAALAMLAATLLVHFLRPYRPYS
jgi:hypothetical protein